MKIVDIILDLLYPPKCVFCASLLGEKEHGICRSCERKLPRLPESRRSDKLSGISICAAPFLYRDNVRASLIRFKFENRPGYKDVYADFIAKAIDENQINCDIITWVPISRRRLRARGYDQTRLIAQALSRRLGKPCMKTLVKTVNNPAQSSLKDADMRKKNVKGVYKCVSPEAVNGKTVLIVDDIVTTGATLKECASTLKGSGAREIAAAALASAN